MSSPIRYCNLLLPLLPSLKTWHLHPSSCSGQTHQNHHALPLLSSPATRTISRSICNCGFKLPLSPAWVVAALSFLINVFPATPPHPHQPQPLTVCSQHSSQGGPRQRKSTCHSCGQHRPGSGLTRSKGCVPAVAPRPHSLPSAPSLQLRPHQPPSHPWSTPAHSCLRPLAPLLFLPAVRPPGFLWRGSHPPSSRVLLKCCLCRKAFLDQVPGSPGIH